MVWTIKQKNFVLLITETNHGLAYDRDVTVSFETFCDVIIVAMVTTAKTYPLKVSF